MSTSISAKDVYSKGYNAVQENDTLSRCLEAFEKGKPPVLAVLDDKGKYHRHDIKAHHFEVKT